MLHGANTLRPAVKFATEFSRKGRKRTPLLSSGTFLGAVVVVAAAAIADAVAVAVVSVHFVDFSRLSPLLSPCLSSFSLCIRREHACPVIICQVSEAGIDIV